MSELDRVRRETDVHLTRGHLRAAGVGVSLLCATTFFVGLYLGGSPPAASRVIQPAQAPREDLVELLARVEASDDVRDGVESLTFPEALTRSSGGTMVEAEPAPPGRFRVEVGKFSDVAEARRLRDHLRSAGAPAWVGAQLQAGVLSWRVASGGFESEDQATAHVAALADVLAGWSLHPEVVAH